jgi:hypothetical protein
MGWESRGGKTFYYTRTLRVGGKVVRTYFGSGAMARQAAADDRRRRVEEMKIRRQEALERVQRRKISDMLDAQGKAIDVIFRIGMADLGYHKHRGEWRRRRGFKTPALADLPWYHHPGNLPVGAPAEPASTKRASAAKSRPARRPMPPRPERRYGSGLVRNALAGMKIIDQSEPAAQCAMPRSGLGENALPIGVRLASPPRRARSPRSHAAAQRPPPATCGGR